MDLDQVVPINFYTAGLFAKINDSEEYLISTVHYPNGSLEAIPFKLELMPILLDGTQTGTYSQFKIVLPDGNAVSLTYKVIE